MNFKRKKLRKIAWAFFWILPFILGAVGYHIGGENLVDALYASFGLYAINPMSDINNWLVIAAKWMAPLMLVSGLVMIMQGISQRIKEFWMGLHGGVTAVYSENEYGKILVGNLKRGILAKEEEARDVGEHILFFSDDRKNLEFYRQNEELLREKKVYMLLNEVDSFLLRESTIQFFNVNEMIARKYWREHNLLAYFDRKKTVKIAVVGFGQLGRSMLNYALMNNIYSLDQRIEYHIWGDACLYEHSMEKMDLMNGDSVAYHGENWQEHVWQLSGMDRVIVTDEPRMDLIQTLLYICDDAEIHYYNPGSASLENIYKGGQLSSFGQYADILTEGNIKSDSLYRAAKELNYKYACMYGGASGEAGKKEAEMDAQWKLLDGFTKGSNIAAADYHEIRKLLVKRAKEDGAELSVRQLGQMEHIRWCRFHFLNHWAYGIPENGKSKDAAHRIHVCLVPFEELTDADQGKDYDAVELLMELMPADSF